jgi:hypothetical protein
MMPTILHSMTLIAEFFVKFVSSPGFIRALGNSERIIKHSGSLFGLSNKNSTGVAFAFFTLPLFLTVAKKFQKILPIHPV